MGRTRIRWQNVGRLAGGLAIGAVALFAAAELLEPPPPEPLPADVGLATGASGFQGYEAVPDVPEARKRERSRDQPAGDRPPPERPDVRPAEVHSEPERRQGREPERSSRESESSAPAVVAAPPAPTPAPVAPAPVPAPPPPSAPEPDAEPVPGDVKAEFGFEP